MQKKFQNKFITADGADRAHIRLTALKTLWFNTGTLCNIECANCYIESSPTNDRLVYIRLDEMVAFLDEIQREGFPVEQIGFTGGEPFMNPDMIDMLAVTLSGGFEALVLTNAMQPMMRSKMCAGLLALKKKFGVAQLILRVSLDHYTKALHDEERGKGAWDKTLEGLAWLSSHGFSLNIAGRTFSGEAEAVLRQNYHAVFTQHNIKVDAFNPELLTLFPEMDEKADVPEITTQCWDILKVNPEAMMCASSRMVVKPRGAKKPEVVACTLLPYQDDFNLGHSLKAAHQSVWLNHPHCAKFCVLGGGTCSVS